jgi:thiol-disulfide isomerase/thioredoxin
MKILFILVTSLLLMAGCSNPEQNNLDNTPVESMNGSWLGELQLNDSTTLRFIYTVANADGRMRVLVKNGGEQVVLKTTFFDGDSIVLDFPVYQSRLVAQVGTEVWLGYFEKTDSRDYRVPFTGTVGFEDRLTSSEQACCELAPRWQVAFNTGTKEIPAIGEFNQKGNVVTGSFLTASGDYRFLEGKLLGNELTLYGFDGGYLQVFKADLRNDSLVNGQYFSGLTGYYTWVATPSQTFELPNPETLSIIRKDIDSISFSYPGLDGSPVGYAPHRNNGKVSILQITGSWCPNCKDQAMFLQQLIDEYGLEKISVLGIAFERMGTLEASIEAAKKSKADLSVNYPVGIAKYNKEQVAEEVFPFIDKIRSYPTLIIIDKKGNVRKVYTGFAGPGTSKYDEVTGELNQFIASLIDE